MYNRPARTGGGYAPSYGYRGTSYRGSGWGSRRSAQVSSALGSAQALANATGQPVDVIID